MSAAAAPRDSVLNARRGQMCYCPGCSHATVLESLGAAIDRLALPPERVCIVSDIGCIGTADQYFNCHTFHGLHGRSITYAEGIKRVRPELTVIVLIGDGGCGIGTAHLVHTARRGVGVKVIVCNNFNFGMTGGQHSPTTPVGGRTTTTPAGAEDRPLDVCQLMITSGAAWVGRFSALDPVCSGQIAAALAHPGFALLDLWELCVAYYMPANQLKAHAFHEIAARLQMPFGLLHAAAPGGSMHRPSIQPARRAEAPVSGLPLTLARGGRVEVCLAGSAGQRIRSAAGVMGEIAVAGGLYAAQLDDFPITVRKGHSLSSLILSQAPIRYIGMDEPDAVVVLSHEGLVRLRALELLHPTARIYSGADAGLPQPPTSGPMRPLPRGELERSAGRGGAALAALTWALLDEGYLDPQALAAAAEAALRGPYRQENLRAIRSAAQIFRMQTTNTSDTGPDPRKSWP